MVTKAPECRPRTYAHTHIRTYAGTNLHEQHTTPANQPVPTTHPSTTRLPAAPAAAMALRTPSRPAATGAAGVGVGARAGTRAGTGAVVVVVAAAGGGVTVMLGRRPCLASCSNVCSVSRASLMLVPMMPEGPRFSHPVTYSPPASSPSTCTSICVCGVRTFPW
jgi:hypothetical protein